MLELPGMRKVLSTLKTLILNLIYPKSCLGCAKPGLYLCVSCLDQIPRAPKQCYVCHHPSINGLTHSKCTTRYSLESLLVFAHYNGLVKKLIKTFKYRFVSEIGIILGNHLAQIFAEELPQVDLVTFVPISKETQRTRGFNQSEILANTISNSIRTPVVSSLTKTKTTKNQAALTVVQRKLNLKGVFQSVGIVKNKRVLLVDDVCTTGTTLNECAKELRKAGASKVYGLVIARGK